MLLEFLERIIMVEEWWSFVKKGDFVWVTHFQHRSLNKDSRVARGQDGMEIKSMMDLVLVKRDMLHYVQDVRVVKGMGRGISDHYVVLCKVRLLGAWLKRRDVVVGARRIRSEKLRKHQYREGYARSLEGKGVEWDGDDNVKHMWEQVKWAMVERATEVCGSVRVKGKNPKRVWWNNEIKAAVRRKDAAWKEVLAASKEEAKEKMYGNIERREEKG